MRVTGALSLLALSAAAGQGGVIQGVTLENASSLPLARTRVKLQRVGDSGLTTVQNAFAGRMGQFVFTGLAEGLYVVSGVRPAYAETVYVAKPGDSRTSLIRLRQEGEFFAEVRVKRLGVITGRIVDENRIGIPNINVVAYSATVPLRRVAEGRSDDRGVYRIFGLPKGKYYVRNATHQLDDGPGLLPTFFPHGTMLKEARSVTVELDRETTDVDIMPVHGKLFSIGGNVRCVPPRTATIVLSSDLGRRETRVLCGEEFSFAELAPGDYELLGSEPEQKLASWVAFSADRERTLTLDLRAYPSLSNLSRWPVVVRRRDLAGEHEPISMAPATHVDVLPGAWEMTAIAPPGQYLDALYIAPAYTRYRFTGDWYDFRVPDASRLQINMRLGERSASVAGAVAYRGEPTPGVPVFLYPVTPETRTRNAGNRLTFSDDKGNYRFDGLPPGRYLIAASFEISTPNEDAMRLARAEDVTLAEGATADVTVALYTEQPQ
jgi:hypothetical protein